MRLVKTEFVQGEKAYNSKYRLFEKQGRVKVGLSLLLTGNR